jgi:signal peptidase I
MRVIDSSAIDATAVNSTPVLRVAAPHRRIWQRPLGRLLIIALVVTGVRTFVGEASVVPTGSMEGTILVGDHLFLDKMLYGPEIPLLNRRMPRLKTIHRGDIVVFRYPLNPDETFLKRVTAVGGDMLEVRNGRLFVNSQAVDEPYVVHRFPLRSAHEHVGPIEVPPGNLFVMGDNRDNSSDSRDWGFVPVENVIGEPLFVYWSYDAPTSRWLTQDLDQQMAFYTSIAVNFFSRTRWTRTGRLL